MNLNQLVGNNPETYEEPDSDAAAQGDGVVSAVDLAVEEPTETVAEIAPELAADESALTETLAAIESLYQFHTKVGQANGMCRSLALEGMAIYPELDGGRNPNHYTVNVTTVRHQPVVESLMDKIKDFVKKAIEGFKKIVKNIIAMCRQWYDRFRDKRLDALMKNDEAFRKTITQLNGLFALHFAKGENQNSLPEWMQFAQLTSGGGEYKSYKALAVRDPYVYALINKHGDLMSPTDIQSFVEVGLKQITETNNLFDALLSQESAEVGNLFDKFNTFNIELDDGTGWKTDFKGYTAAKVKDYLNAAKSEMALAGPLDLNYNVATITQLLTDVVPARTLYDLIKSFNTYFDEVFKLDEVLAEVIKRVNDDGFALEQNLAQALVKAVNDYAAEAFGHVHIFRSCLMVNFNMRTHTYLELTNYFEALEKLVKDKTPETSKEMMKKVEPLLKELNVLTKEVTSILIKE